jgi:acyl-CoA thioesterase
MPTLTTSTSALPTAPVFSSAARLFALERKAAERNVMGNLRSDTEVTGADGRWFAKVSPDWRLWSPNGGYLATIAMRATGRESAGMRPASLTCSFLKSPQTGTVELTTAPLRRSSRAHATRVTMIQDGDPILDATVWSVRPGLDGLPARNVPPPADVPLPESLLPLEKVVSPEKVSRDPFWQHLEERVVNPDEHARWPEEPGPAAERLTWLRFRPDPLCGNPVDAPDDPDTPYVDAGRAVLAVDAFIYPAAVFPLSGDQLTHLAPTFSLSVNFHHLQPMAEWLLLHVADTTAGQGLVGGRAMVWADNGMLAASGSAQLLCRAVH